MTSLCHSKTMHSDCHRVISSNYWWAEQAYLVVSTEEYSICNGWCLTYSNVIFYAGLLPLAINATSMNGAGFTYSILSLCRGQHIEYESGTGAVIPLHMGCIHTYYVRSIQSVLFKILTTSPQTSVTDTAIGAVKTLQYGHQCFLQQYGEWGKRGKIQLPKYEGVPNGQLLSEFYM